MKIISRVTVTEDTLSKFIGSKFKWGSNDCTTIAYKHLRKMGHKVKKSGHSKYNTLIGAQRALKEMGFTDTSDAMDYYLERIPYALIQVGDLVGLDGESGMTAITVYVGNGRVLGFSENTDECVVMQPLEFPKMVWRVECLR